MILSFLRGLFHEGIPLLVIDESLDHGYGVVMGGNITYRVEGLSR